VVARTTWKADWVTWHGWIKAQRAVRTALRSTEPAHVGAARAGVAQNGSRTGAYACSRPGSGPMTRRGDPTVLCVPPMAAVTPPAIACQLYVWVRENRTTTQQCGCRFSVHRPGAVAVGGASGRGRRGTPDASAAGGPAARRPSISRRLCVMSRMSHACVNTCMHVF
jgi:hypothetical protein